MVSIHVTTLNTWYVLFSRPFQVGRALFVFINTSNITLGEIQLTAEKRSLEKIKCMVLNDLGKTHNNAHKALKFKNVFFFTTKL